MSTYHGYTCEKCGTDHRHGERTDGDGYHEQPVCLSIGVNYGYTYPNTNVKSVLWCRKCVKEAGLDEYHNAQNAKKPDAPPEPSLQERIETLLREMGFVQQHDLP